QHHGLLTVDQPADSSIPYPVLRSVVQDLSKYPFPSDSPVSTIEAVHDRVSIEIARGCVDGCRFCQAGTIYRPVRERKPGEIIDTIIDGIQKGGYDETSLTSLSTADYTCLEPLVKMLGDELEKRKVSFSVSSLRASGVSESLAREIARVRKTGFTIAPEAGTQRMRDVINKNVTEEDVLGSCRVAFSEGWSSIKMYFMIGLPTETEEDVVGIAELGRKVKQLGRNEFNKSVKVTCSASYFVPKPHTPFQWCAQEDIESIKRKQRLLKELGRRYHIDVKVHHAETSLLEGVISRGDRALCRVIERAWRMGCRFDGWTEWFDYEKWMDAFRAEGVDITPYLQEFPVKAFSSPRGELIQLPWDHIDTLVKRDFLAKEYIKGVKAKISPPCELPVKIIDGRPTAIAPSHEDFERVMSQPLLCYNCGMECDLTMSRKHLEEALALHKEVRTYRERAAGLSGQPGASSLIKLKSRAGDGDGLVDPDSIEFQPETAAVPSAAADQAAVTAANAGPAGFRYRTTFAKSGPVKYLSHLDMTRALPRAFRRAGIALNYSQGFHPMPLIQYGPALGVGCEGENEILEFNSPEMLNQGEFLNRINRVTPQGFAFKSLRRLSAGDQPLVRTIDRAEYFISIEAPEITQAMSRLEGQPFQPDPAVAPNSHRRLVNQFMARESFNIVRTSKNKRQNVDVRRYTVQLEADTVSGSLRLVTEISPNGGVKPVEVVAAVYGLTDEEKISLSSRIKRTRLYREDPAGQSCVDVRPQDA
ncbi:MAG TPA: TIGR03936 family radical SAM-associated protein, partial [Blastocatellia bacterium]|nr:TIGR03936 family radical SAM-associated protein [Blastocatellia bacterium]